MSSVRKPSDAEAADTINSLKDAEARSAREIQQAGERKGERIKKAHEKALAGNEKASADAAALKERLVSEAREKIAAEEHSIIAKARKEAESVRKKKVPAKAIDAALAKMVRELNA